MKKSHLLKILATFFIFVSGAQATVFQFQSTCIYECANYGLADMDEIYGTITTFDSLVHPNNAIDETGIESFLFSFGTFSIDNTSAVSFSFEGVLNGNGSSFDSFTFAASEGLDSVQGDTFFFLFNDAENPANQGRFGPGKCNVSCSRSSVFTYPGAANLSNVASLTVVSEPSSLWLFSIGLFGLLNMSKRRNKAS